MSEISQEDMNNAFDRIGSNEQKLASVISTLGTVVDSVNKLSTKVDSLVASGKTNWGVLATWASVVLAIMVYHGNLVMKPVRAMSTYRHEQQQLQIEELDTVLQREMRLLDDTSKAEIKALDTMLQREMRLLLNRHEIATKQLQDEIIRIRKWKDSVEGTIPKLQEKIDHMFIMFLENNNER